MTNSEIKQRANGMLAKYVKCGGIHKVWGVVMAGENIKYRQIDTENMEFVGALTRGRNGQSYIMTNAAINNDGRRNFTIAHELGHFILGHNLCSNALICVNDGISEEGAAALGIEQEANYFAACLLMPEEKVKRAFWGMLKNSKKAKNKGRLDVKNDYSFSIWCGIRDDLTKRYGVSETALRYRLKSLNLATFHFQ